MEIILDSNFNNFEAETFSTYLMTLCHDDLSKWVTSQTRPTGETVALKLINLIYSSCVQIGEIVVS